MPFWLRAEKGGMCFINKNFMDAWLCVRTIISKMDELLQRRALWREKIVGKDGHAGMGGVRHLHLF